MTTPDFPTAALSAIPVVISPIIAWALGRSRVSKEVAELDYLNKRLDFVERLNKLQEQLTSDTFKQLMETELEHSRTFLRQIPSFVISAEETETIAPSSRLGRFFLSAPAKTRRQRIFKGLFYFFFFFGLFGLALSFLSLVRGDVQSGPADSFVRELFYTQLAGAGFYFAISLICRRFAR
jgi:hypothetical protein